MYEDDTNLVIVPFTSYPQDFQRALEPYMDSTVLAAARARFEDDDPPPPYSPSGNTTVVPSPRQTHEDLERSRLDKLQKSTPFGQFERQTALEEERLSYQFQEDFNGRRMTLPFDKTLSYTANARNNIRKSWLELGIWADERGPAWPSDGPIHGLNVHDWKSKDQQCWPFCDPQTGAV